MYPSVRSLVKRLAKQPFVLLGINIDVDREALKKTLEKESITWRSGWDGGSTNGPIQTEWQVARRPRIILLGSQGIIRHKDVIEDELEDTLEGLLKELANEPNN